jgi:hypothetical protein
MGRTEVHPTARQLTYGWLAMSITTTRAGRPGARSAAFTRTLGDLQRVRSLAAATDRPDLVERLDRARIRLSAIDVPVVVVGEFKQGKSTLVNALLRTDVCPVDPDIVTAVPTILRYGSPPSAVAYTAASDDPGDSPVPVDVPFERLRDVITGAGSGRLERAVRSVEVRLDRALLRSGLSLVDTPGVGGLDSAHGNIVLGTLPLARAVLFVTDAAQELTAPELEFLSRAVERCPRVFCVVTKTDLYAEWRRIVELNRGHLTRAGLQMPIVAVSSFLRLRAAAADAAAANAATALNAAAADAAAVDAAAALNAESGVPRLLDILRRNVLASADAAAVRSARQETAFAVTELRDQLGAERAAVRNPQEQPVLMDRLAEKARRSRQLGVESASWQTVLSDGIQDLSTDIDHDLRDRLRALQRRGDALLDAEDPKDNWHGFQAWAAREATSAATDNLFTLITRTEQLARDVAERFDLDYDGLDLDLPAPAVALGRVAELEARFDRSSMRQLLGAFAAARLTYGGVFLLGAFGSLFSLSVAAPIGVVAGVVLGRKLVRDERERQLEYRRQQAKAELRRYIDEVGFVLGKDCRDAVRRTQRFLRDEFASRAVLVERSSTQALAAVRQAAELADDERTRRVSELDAKWRDLDELAARVGASR